jgi:two-component system, OmpR family, sensor histidine kinase TctE
MTPTLPALGTRLRRHVLWPLALTWLVGTAVAIGVAQWFAQRAFDRSLLDDAHVLAANVQAAADGALRLQLSSDAVRTVLFDQAETMFFAIRAADGSLVAGDARLDLPGREDAPFRFDELRLAGRELRVVVLERAQPRPHRVIAAQTTAARTRLLQQLLLYSILPQLGLLALLAWWLRRAIDRDVAPLAGLREAVAGRDVRDLRPVPVAATTRDVAALAGAINALLERLQRSMKAQREFSGNVAHELRTPLAGIRALAAYGLAQKDPAAWREQLQAIAASQERASRLVDKLLALSLANEAEAGLQLAPLALDELVREAVLRFLPRADAQGVDLGALGVDGAPVQVLGDATLIEGLLNNLLDNALRYGTGGSQPAITVAVERSGPQVRLSVQDNGPGLPDARQAELIERGAQGETGQLLGQGAGLGLALVAQYARLMGAGMSLGSGPEGRGWLCTVTLRAAD